MTSGAGAALARAWGKPVCRGRIRLQPGDFRVDEQLGFEPSGAGDHWLLRVEKTGCNTHDVVRTLADCAGVPARDVGFSGLKDRHATCRQWISVPCSGDIDWRDVDVPGFRVLSCERHARKLRRGTHVANHFAIRVWLDESDHGLLERRMDCIGRGGVPNYFGEQRFGRHFAANASRLVAGRRLQRLQRSMTLSAMRSGIFNHVLDRRVSGRNWNLPLPGEYVNLDGTRSGFPAADDDSDILRRVAAMDLHPTGTLFGRGTSSCGGEAAALEDEVLAGFRSWCEVLTRYGLRQERRATRCVVRNLDWSLAPAEPVLHLGFTLRRGEFATSVLREIVHYRDVTRDRPAATASPGDPKPGPFDQ